MEFYKEESLQSKGGKGQVEPLCLPGQRASDLFVSWCRYTEWCPQAGDGPSGGDRSEAAKLGLWVSGPSFCLPPLAEGFQLPESIFGLGELK